MKPRIPALRCLRFDLTALGKAAAVNLHFGNVKPQVLKTNSVPPLPASRQQDPAGRELPPSKFRPCRMNLRPAAGHPGPNRTTGRPEKDSTLVLCVEDESATLALLVHLLEKRFSQVLVAKNGAEGLAVFKRHHPLIVITDIQMPVMNGIDMARAIKAEAPATHIIVITSHDETSAILSAIDVGVVDYVLKPIVAERLGSAIEKCFQVASLERALRLSKSNTECILESLGDTFFALDRNWRFTYLNQQAEDHFRTPRSKLLGTSFRDLIPDPTTINLAYVEAMQSQQKRAFEIFLPGQGRWFDVSIFPMDGGISVYLRDITEKIKNKDEIQFLAFHDKLTGLPNRTLLYERIAHAIVACKRSGQRGAVLFLDLDRFKTINDSLGHEAGDRVLQEVANRLQGSVRGCDTVSRLGGDEFVVLLEGFEHPDNIHSITHRLLLSLAQEISIQGFSLSISGSIGIGFIPADGETVEELLKAADTAMYHGKSHGRNTYHFYRPEMNVEKRHFLHMESALRNSVKNQEFLLQYQPQFDLQSEEILGFEALVRWRHPELGLIYPNEFIPLAEETGLILLLGNWVLENACSQTRSWMSLHPKPIRMAVNLSGRQFWQSDLVESIAQGLAKSGLPPERLELEITESMVMRDVDLAIEKMHELVAMGVHLSMDDFGTGYSSLAALQRFPIHTLKIDKSFVKEITTNSNDAAICSSIIDLAHTMNLTVVAEGIETREQLDFLQEKGCEIGQGYFFSRPLPAQEAQVVLLRKAEALRSNAVAQSQVLLRADSEAEAEMTG